MSPKQIASLIGAACLIVFAWVFYSQLFYTNDATKIVVFQAPISGRLSVQTSAGTTLRLGAGYQAYKKQDNFDFEYQQSSDRSIPVQFNDGGKATVGGNVQWEMPMDSPNVIALHTLYGSQEGIDNKLIRNAINRAMTLTAPLMSSTDSYAARRSDFLQIFADQLVNGIYQTRSYEDIQPDPITGDKKVVHVVTIVRDKDGKPLRSEESPLQKYGIQIQPPTIDKFIYEPNVEAQIQQQRGNIMAIQTAQAEAKKAEQAAITAAKNGEAQAVKAKWDQEVQKATQVTLAEQNKRVAELNADRDKSVAETAANRDKIVAETAANRDLQVAQLKAQTAEQYRIEQTKMGEGDAARRLAAMNADGALTQKIDAWVRGQELWASAFANFKGSVVPQIVTGTSATNAAGNAATDFMSIMGMKAAKDLALDMTVGARVKQ